jgi:hypothetical protein
MWSTSQPETALTASQHARVNDIACFAGSVA